MTSNEAVLINMITTLKQGLLTMAVVVPAWILFCNALST